MGASLLALTKSIYDILHSNLKKLHKGVVDYSIDRWPELNLPKPDNLSNFTFLHSISNFYNQKMSTFCTVWDKLTCSANERAEFSACTNSRTSLPGPTWGRKRVAVVKR